MCHRPLGVVFSTPHWVYPGSGASHYRHSGKAWVTQTSFIHSTNESSRWWLLHSLAVFFLADLQRPHFFLFCLLCRFILQYGIGVQTELTCSGLFRRCLYICTTNVCFATTVTRFLFVCLCISFLLLSFCLCRGLHCGMLSQTCFLTNCVFSELGEYGPH